MKRILLSAAVTALLLAPLACNFDQLLAEKVMVGTLLSTPDVDVSLYAMAGGDAGTLPDGGVPENERLTIPGQTAAFVFLATRDGEQGQPEPITNATVRIETLNGSPIALDNKGVGTYGLTSAFGDESGVKYQNGATYNFVAVHDGNSHVGQVKDAPALERIAALHPTGGYVRHVANQGLTLTRPANGGKERTLGFVTVVPVSRNGDKGEPTYTNMPKEPLDFLQLVTATGEWQQATLSIPGSAFPQKDSNYLVVFQTAQLGGPQSDNLFTGSTLLVGTADLGLVHTVE
ncbi:hypothetical protein ATI61_102369 [Archangium gephyra]|uniref:Lipoprotein n=1 Tax=Archangium gephyra TaxID=48 RepID=A0AAC8TGK6_9BACT|nr:hypothetical protein [Archangium gephyra]AKJ05307.1 putative lipoprotein [Archangium gephyra]REG35995.1 hypothetical protein ATI61_102369 [Archangium gephyra]